MTKPERCDRCGKFMKNGFCSGSCDDEVVRCCGAGCEVDFRNYKGSWVVCVGHIGMFCEKCVPYYYLDEPLLGGNCTCTACACENAHVDDDSLEREAYERLKAKRIRLGWKPGSYAR